MLEEVERARRIVEVASEKQATDILLLDIREVSTFADFFVIMSADSQRQMEALVEEIAQEIKRQGVRLHHREGTSESGWLLLDCGDVIVHIFAPQERDYYRLEEVWSRARLLVRIQ